jgi:hypothetical protein
VIEKDGDVDWFRFHAKKGDKYEIRAHARSSVAARPRAHALRRRREADRDATTTRAAPTRPCRSARRRRRLRAADPRPPPQGRRRFVYRIEFNTVKPSVYTHIPAYDREPRDQIRQWIVVPKGNRFATWIRTQPPGLQRAAQPVVRRSARRDHGPRDPVAAEVDRVIAVFEAAPDAKVAGSLIDVVAKSADGKVEGGFRQDVNLVYGPPNNTIYYGTRANKLAVAVAEEAPFTLKLVEPKVPIVQNGSMNLKVVAERKKDFTAPIELRFLWSPPGIGAQGTVTIPRGQSEALYPINANGNAATKTWKIAVIGSAPAPTASSGSPRSSRPSRSLRRSSR